MPEKYYDIAMEVAADFAMFPNVADSGSEQATAPVPTPSSVKGMFESVLFIRHAEVMPHMVHICRPLGFIETGFNYVHGPLRKSQQIDGGNALQNRMLMITNVVYQLFARVRDARAETASFASAASLPFLHKINHAHSYQEQFVRRLRSGALHRPVTLGKAICMATYVGPLRPETKPCESINLTLPVLLKSAFTRPMFGKVDFSKVSVLHNLKVKNGVLCYA